MMDERGTETALGAGEIMFTCVKPKGAKNLGKELKIP